MQTFYHPQNVQTGRRTESYVNVKVAACHGFFQVVLGVVIAVFGVAGWIVHAFLHATLYTVSGILIIITGTFGLLSSADPKNARKTKTHMVCAILAACFGLVDWIITTINLSTIHGQLNILVISLVMVVLSLEVIVAIAEVVCCFRSQRYCCRHSETNRGDAEENTEIENNSFGSRFLLVPSTPAPPIYTEYESYQPPSNYEPPPPYVQ